MTIDAVLTPADIAQLPATDLSNKVCVVFDVLRATSSMVTALHHGAESVFPVTTVEEAQAARRKDPEAVLAGERKGDRIDGFDVGNSPSEYVAFAGRRIISTTTNGTVALRACDGSHEVLAAALLNLRATADFLKAGEFGEVVVVCAGTHEFFALEDAFAAGALIDLLDPHSLTDSAFTLHQMFLQNRNKAQEVLRLAANGQALLAAGREGDIEWCAQVSVFNTVVRRSGDRLVSHPQTVDFAV